MLTGLSNASDKTNLFTSEKDEKINSLMRSIDNTNHRYGRSTLSVASAGVHKKWNMRRQYSSKIETAVLTVSILLFVAIGKSTVFAFE